MAWVGGLRGLAPQRTSGLQRRSYILRAGEIRLDEREALQQPGGEARLAQGVEDVPAVAAIADDVVAPQEREVLGHPRVAHLEHLGEEVDVVLARAQLLDDPHAVRMGEGAEQLSELLGRDDSCSHVLIFAYMKAKRHRRA